LLAGLAAAVALALQQFVGVAVTDYWVVGFAVFTAATAYIVRNARGQWITIGTLIGTAGAAIYKAHENGGHVDVFQLILLAVLSALGAAAPAAKSIEYEHSTPILEAKAEAKAMVEAKKEEDNKPDSKPPTIKYT
jgi:hypothetical protein